ncbi:MAG: hypothetical protein A2015_05760 [Spirochaetes bacterium GWF1_31_7]|nr:MAG: hypothetical protein A2Y30_00170 [Spirochaetes bacterium GWE1_32_154]OHD47196.1 MAG: hypothetical protein A2Y29_10755 [Spirochaetes bacterium GWE2_31_10]OHD48929.1 MAG: hypothetical protein A2015_05760 [Spirochaetes bacterium GWF1_31_7]OHD81839.1 MAG: hypothetical protein A2355_13935 [Spirochaetes bacterium RIFOXYB1_FULL_32_8]HBD92596.1 hypothetical protein [Spirochaetia bacterium]
MKRLLIFVCFVLLYTQLYSIARTDDIIILNDGSEYHGELTAINETMVSFKSDDTIRSFEVKTVYMIALSGERKYDAVNTINNITDKEIVAGYTTLLKYKPLPDENAVYYLEKNTIRYENDTIIKNTKVIYKILTDAGKSNGSASFTYPNSAINASLLYAITITPEGKVFSVKENALNREPINNTYPLYDSYKRLKFSMQHPDPGNIFVYEYEIRYQVKPFENILSEQFFLRSESVILNKQLIISGYKGRLKNFISKGEASFQTPEIINKPGFFSAYSYNIERIVIDEDFTPSTAYIIPHIFIYQPVNMKAFVTHFNSFANIDVTDIHLKQYIQSLNIEKSDTTNLVTTLYKHLINSLKHADFPPSYTDFQTNHLSAITKENRLSSLDKAYLFQSVLKYYAISSDIFLSTKDFLPDSYKRLQIPFIFDEAGLIINIEGKNRFIIFDNEQRYIDNFPERLSEKPLLCMNNKQPVRKITKLEHHLNNETIQYNIQYNEDSIDLTKHSISHGTTGNQYRKYRFLSNEEKVKKFKNSTASIKTGADLENFEIVSDLSDISKPVEIKTTIKAENYAIKSGDISLFYLPEFTYNSTIVSQPEREFTGIIPSISSLTRIYTITVPENYRVKYTPSNKKIHYLNSSFDIQYSLNENVISVTIKSVINTPVFKPAQYPQFKQFIEERALLSRTPIIMEKKK